MNSILPPTTDMQDEARPERRITRRDYTSTTRLWGLCIGCRWRWSWAGKSCYVADGLAAIQSSTCRCIGRPGSGA